MHARQVLDASHELAPITLTQAGRKVKSRPTDTGVGGLSPEPTLLSA